MVGLRRYLQRYREAGTTGVLAIGMLAIALLGSAGCSSGSGTSTPQGAPVLACALLTDADVTPWEGIYQLVSDTNNPMSCSAEGPSVLASQSETLFFLRSRSGPGGADLWLLSCTGVADCQAKRSQFDQSQANMTLGPAASIVLGFACRGPNGSLADTAVSTGVWQSDGTCQSPSVAQETLAHDTNGNARVEVRTRLGDTYKQVNGFCDTNAAYAASANKPCTEYEVFAGKFLQAM
jgi:hypothetical protein